MDKADYPSVVLVGDVGGTHARFALAEGDPARPQIRDLAHLPSADFTSLEAAVAAYLEKTQPKTRPHIATIAVAGPVVDGKVTLTNLSWHASESKLTEMGLAKAKLINDFRALAAAADALGTNDLDAIGPDLPRADDAPIVIAGAGTGFGTSALVREKGKSITVASEGGHIGFSPEDETEAAVLRILMRRFGRVSIERIVSGPGLVNLYEALCEIEGAKPQFSEPPQILSEAEREDGTAREAVERFCAIFGAAAGDLALAFGARGGVLLAGGLSEALTPFLKAGAFRARFEGKGRLAHLVRAIPTHMITRDDAALLGCAKVAHELARSKR